MAAVTRIEFGQDDLENAMAGLSPAEFDRLTFGAIELDATGKVLNYNATEGSISGRKKEDVIGRNFFRDIAPCCNKPGFRGVFDAGVRAGELNAIFDYVFDYKMNPTRVKIHMKCAMVGSSYRVFVRRV